MNKKKYISVICIFTLSVAIVLIVGHFFTTKARVEQSLFRMADDMCKYRETYGSWPNTLSDMPHEYLDGIEVMKFEYDPKRLTLSRSVNIRNQHHLRNLWNMACRNGRRSYSDTHSISVSLSGRWVERHPESLRDVFLQSMSRSHKEKGSP